MATVRFIPDVEIPLADGLTSRADIYLPEDSNRHPVLLARTPYSKVLTAKELDLLNPLRAARRGYAVVIQDCRGRFSSEGEFTPFLDDGRDGVAAVSWCAQQSWSTGRVGLWGMSYFGATQLLTAVEAPDALVAMIPALTASRYDEGWFFEGGVLRQALAQNWMAIVASETVRRRQGVGRESVAEVASDARALERSVERPFGADQDEIVPFYTDLIAHRDDPAWWDSFAINTRYNRVAIPGLHITCWYDIFLEGAVENYVGLRNEATTQAARDGQRLIIGPGGHGLFVRYFGDQDYGAAAAALDVPGLHYRFFDQHFGLGTRSAPGELDQPVTLFLLGVNRWVGFQAWPPPAAPRSLYLGGLAPNSVRGDGALGDEAPATLAEHRFLNDPQRPVPTLGGALLGMGAGPRPGPYDQRRIEERDDVLVYTSEPLRSDLPVVGQVFAELDVDSTADSFHVCVKLVDVAPTGEAINIADSVARSSVAGRQVLRVRVGSVGVVFRAGHRIRIQVAGSNFPRLERSPGPAAIHSLFTGLSRVILPIVDIAT